MRNSKSTLFSIFVIIALLTAFFLVTRNNLISLEEDVNLQLSQVETNLQRRSDLIPNLVATVKGYATYEEEVFTEIADARAKLSGSIQSGNVDEINSANKELDSALSRLLVISEDYPDLKASEQFIGLQDELAGTENRIAVSRQYYNEAVQTYNKAIKKFPNSIIAGIIGCDPMPYFEANEEAKTVPEVNFD